MNQNESVSAGAWSYTQELEKCAFQINALQMLILPAARPQNEIIALVVLNANQNKDYLRAS